MTLFRSDPHAQSRTTLLAIYVVAAVLVASLVLASTLGRMVGIAAIGAAAVAALLAAIGAERMGLVSLAVGYFMAPFYKGVAIGDGAVVTVPDLLLLGGFTLLLPRLVRGRVRFPAAYSVGVALVLLAGLGASVGSARAAESLIALAFWMIVMLGLPVAIVLWGPSGRQIDLLAASFVAGHIFSFLMGAALGNESNGRQAGLATHSNYLAQAGMLAICLLIYLAYRHMSRSVLITSLIAGAGAMSVTSVLMSGSRAGTVVVAVLVLMIPVVERSAFHGFLVAAAASLFLLALPMIAQMAGEGSVFSRLAGDSSAQMSNMERRVGLEDGIARFFDHPLRGTGLTDLFFIHNNFVEVAVGIGVFGLVGYLLVLYAFVKPLFGKGEYRRLGYVVCGYIGLGATIPGLYDRCVWSVVALGAVAMALPVGAPMGDRADSSIHPPPPGDPVRIEASGRSAVRISHHALPSPKGPS